MTADGIVAIRLLPKESRRVKCGVCNRQQGVCVRCTFPGCTTYFHPICAERLGKGYVRTRLGEREAYCPEHVPIGLERCSGHLVDGFELHRLRFSLDRSRIILDTLLRREKFKIRLCKVEGEYFTSSFYRILDRAKGRKRENVLGEEETVEDSESEYGDDDDDEDINDQQNISLEISKKSNSNANRRIKKIKENSFDDEFMPIKFSENIKESITVEMGNTEKALISGFWTENGVVKLPNRVSLLVAGLPVMRHETDIEGGKRIFMKNLKEKSDKLFSISISDGFIFGTLGEALDFSKEITPSLIKHMKMSDNQFYDVSNLLFSLFPFLFLFIFIFIFVLSKK